MRGCLIALAGLKQGKWVTIRLQLHPPATTDDLPYLTELARALARRL